jgi:hypothetical protein
VAPLQLGRRRQCRNLVLERVELHLLVKVPVELQQCTLFCELQSDTHCAIISYPAVCGCTNVEHQRPRFRVHLALHLVMAQLAQEVHACSQDAQALASNKTANNPMRHSCQQVQQCTKGGEDRPEILRSLLKTLCHMPTVTSPSGALAPAALPVLRFTPCMHVSFSLHTLESAAGSLIPCI